VEAYQGRVNLFQLDEKAKEVKVATGFIVPNPPVAGDTVTIINSAKKPVYATKIVTEVNEFSGVAELATKHAVYRVRTA